MVRQRFLALPTALSLMLTACASTGYVDKRVEQSEERLMQKIDTLETAVEANQAEISKLHLEDARLAAELDEVSATARDALERATQASKLARGKILYEVVLSDDQVQFGFNASELSQQAKVHIDAFAARIRADNRDVYIEVQGHTDSIGSERYNLGLGLRRAEQVMRYLVEAHGLPRHRLDIVSYGEAKPIADNSTAEGRSRNRRVTLVVLE